MTFTVTNKSAVPLSGLKVSLDNAENFTLDIALMDASLAPGESTTCTVSPKAELAQGSYQTNITVTSDIPDVVAQYIPDQVAPAEATMICTVKTVGLTAAPASLDFGSAYTGYSQPEAKTVTVTNTGEQAVTLTQPASQYYDVITAGRLELPVGGKATFTVQPKTGLTAGEYSETLTVSGTYGVSADVALRFVVEQQSGGGSSGGSSSGGGGGGSGSAMYVVSLAAPEHGTVTLSPKSAVKGSTVTVTATPDEGYQLDTLTVTDNQGNRLKLTDQGGGKFTFIMPGSQVKVEASFVLIPEEPDQPEPLPFADVDETAWYYDGVAYVYEKGLMTGTGETTFNPDGATSRAMLAAILWRLEGSPVVNYAMDFADVEEGQWYTEAIRWAASEGIVTGYGDGAFGTNDSITREQFAVMLYRYAGAQPASGTLSAFRDGAAVSDWAAEAMGWAVEAGLITGTGDGSALTPQGQATRAQAAVLLMRWQEALS